MIALSPAMEECSLGSISLPIYVKAKLTVGCVPSDFKRGTASWGI